MLRVVEIVTKMPLVMLRGVENDALSKRNMEHKGLNGGVLEIYTRNLLYEVTLCYCKTSRRRCVLY